MFRDATDFFQRENLCINLKKTAWISNLADQGYIQLDDERLPQATELAILGVPLAPSESL